jgi:hypothetical protein
MHAAQEADRFESAMKGTAKQLELIGALLRGETTLSLATSGEGGGASVAPLFYIADEELSLYCGVQMRGSVSKVTEPERRAALVKTYCERFKLGRVFRLALHTSILYCLRPEFLRYIDNARRFGYKFELTRRPEGWSVTRPEA